VYNIKMYRFQDHELDKGKFQNLIALGEAAAAFENRPLPRLEDIKDDKGEILLVI
jgi:hypothetical protein